MYKNQNPHMYTHTYIHEMFFNLTSRLPTLQISRIIDRKFECINVELLHCTLLSLSETNVFKMTDSTDGDIR